MLEMLEEIFEITAENVPDLKLDEIFDIGKFFTPAEIEIEKNDIKIPW